MIQGSDHSDGKVLVVESRCKDVHDLIPTARKLAQELRRLDGEGYDVCSVTIQGVVVRDDRLIVPTCNLGLVDGDPMEKP